MQYKTLSKLKKVILVYFISSLILIIYDSLKPLNRDGEKDVCNVNIFYGSLEPFNAAIWIISRSAACISSSLVVLFLFFKSKQTGEQYHQMVNETRRTANSKFDTYTNNYDTAIFSDSESNYLSADKMEVVELQDLEENSIGEGFVYIGENEKESHLLKKDLSDSIGFGH